MNQELTDLYTALGVGRAAGLDEIEVAYASWRERVAAGEPIADQTWERVRYAYDVLSNPQRREIYDSLVTETAGTSLDLDLRISGEKLPLTDSPQVLYVLIALSARETKSERHRPLNLGLVVDRSTSMRGERLEKVTAAVGLLLDKLGPDDSLSLVSFSDRAEVVLPAATLGRAAQNVDPETAAAWRDPRRRLRSIVASGGTEIFQGLRAGLAQLSRSVAEDTTSHLILLTDGHTYGDASDCLRLAEAAAARGIGITAFGLGADWNDSFLDALVAPSGGQSHFIEKADDVLPHLEGRLRGLGAIHARNLTLRRTWPAQFSLRAGFKLAPFPQPLALDTDPIPLGDLEGRSPVAVLLEFLIAPQTIAARFRLPIEAHYTAADGKEETAGRSLQLVVLGGDSDAPGAGAPTGTLIEAVRRLNLYRMQEKAWEEAQPGKLDTAAARMRRLTSRYMETGDLRLAGQAQLEAQQLARMGAISPEGRKLLKYGTRLLIGQLES
jgi:Ca-activated chloride channel family protein